MLYGKFRTRIDNAPIKKYLKKQGYIKSKDRIKSVIGGYIIQNKYTKSDKIVLFAHGNMELILESMDIFFIHHSEKSNQDITVLYDGMENLTLDDVIKFDNMTMEELNQLADRRAEEQRIKDKWNKNDDNTIVHEDGTIEHIIRM